MSPIDDELRAALHRRADVLVPSPDPLAGIERRARRIRRTRTASALAGTALAVAAVALAVPVLTPAAGPAPVPAVAPSAGPSPTTAPSPGPSPAPPVPPRESPAVTPTDVAFSFEDPWDYRGDASLLEDGAVQTWTREWAASQGAPVGEVDLVPLFGEVHEPSGLPRVVYAARVRASEKAEYGLVVSSESGPEFLARTPLAPRAKALLLAVPGDEVPALLVLAAPSSRAVQYAPDGRSFSDLAVRAPGAGTGPLDGDSSADAVRVLAADGSRAYAGPAPDLADSDEPAAEPDNLLGWPSRGTQDDALVQRAVAGYADAKGVPVTGIGYDVLFTGDNDPGQRYALLQAWVRGERAQVFGWVETPGREPEPVLQPLTDPGKPVVALLLTDVPGRTTDELVVVPQPRTGQVLYTPEGGTERPVETPGLDGVVLVDRERGARSDRLRLLDGNGDLDRPTFDGEVAPLLCRAGGCD